MPPLQPHDPRIRYRPGVKVYCDNQAAEDALGGGWSRYPQPSHAFEESTIAVNTALDIDAMTMALHVVSPKKKRGRPRKAR
jgi:hypothetical protein